VEAETLYGQYDSYRAFIPGEPVNMKGGYTQQRLPVFAGSFPHVDAGSGDKRGLMLGTIAGSHDLSMFDPHGGPARDESGMVLTAARQGGGKSKLQALIAEFCVNQLAVRTIINDPSGPAEHLAEVPWLARHTRVADLSSAKPGT